MNHALRYIADIRSEHEYEMHENNHIDFILAQNWF